MPSEFLAPTSWFRRQCLTGTYQHWPLLQLQTYFMSDIELVFRMTKLKAQLELAAAAATVGDAGGAGAETADGAVVVSSKSDIEILHEKRCCVVMCRVSSVV